ncbi:(Lipo)protein [Seminavis robusta]|uniref:(Lipo)protein n=1 Tax=Seminavis robusta TaxID=568900 RepID=A0A9N8HHQ6_9STRA|nr:(Lipo)protein [Seminavis robusta]|eukprot:Sro723_g193030.1 (Lipo)protein (358) ;mRNA; f:33059-34220
MTTSRIRRRQWLVPSLLSVCVATVTTRTDALINGGLDNDSIRYAVAMWLDHEDVARDQFGSIADWSTWQVTDMAHLFQGAASFDDDISQWDVSSVTDMNHIFAGCQQFNGNLSQWNVQYVTDFSYAFAGASNFTAGDSSSLGHWDTSSAITMEHMFVGASSFIGDGIASWNVRSVTSLQGMLSHAASFNQDVNSWDMSNVVQTNELFLGASALNQQICWKQMHFSSRFYQCFCGTDGASFGSSCDSLIHPSIRAYSEACNPEGDIVEDVVFARPADYMTGFDPPEGWFDENYGVSGFEINVEEDEEPDDQGGIIILAAVRREASGARPQCSVAPIAHLVFWALNTMPMIIAASRRCL